MRLLVALLALMTWVTTVSGQQMPLSWTGTTRGTGSTVQQKPRLLKPLAQEPHLHASEIKKTEGIERRFRSRIPEQLPAFILPEYQSLELVLAELQVEGWLALYKGACNPLGDACQHRIAFFDQAGVQRWTVDPAKFWDGFEEAEVQDVRYHGGIVYFNAEGPTHRAASKKACGVLFGVDPISQKVVWQTPAWTSDHRFLVTDAGVVTGHGRHAEPRLYLLDRLTGTLKAFAILDAPHQYLEAKDGQLTVLTDSSVYSFPLK